MPREQRHRKQASKERDAAQAQRDIDAAFNWLVAVDRRFFRRADRAGHRMIGFMSSNVESVLRAAQRSLTGRRSPRRHKVLPPPIRVWPRP